MTGLKLVSDLICEFRISEIYLLCKTRIHAVSGIVACGIVHNEGLGNRLNGAVYLILTVGFTKIGIVIEIKSAAVDRGIEIRKLKATVFGIQIIVSVIKHENRSVLAVAGICGNDLFTGVNTDKLTRGIVDADSDGIGIKLIAYAGNNVADARINENVAHIHLECGADLALVDVLTDLAVSLAVIKLHKNSDSLIAALSVGAKSVGIENDLGKLHRGIVICPAYLISLGEIIRKSGRASGGDGLFGRSSSVGHRSIDRRTRSGIGSRSFG